MRTLLMITGAALALASTPALANEERAGDFQFKVLGTAVLPDGEIDRVNVDIVGLPANTQTAASDNYVPTIAVEYFVTNNISIETIAGMTQHDVDAVSGLPGAELVSDAKLIPATVTAKLHFGLGDSIKPYVGAGPAYFLWVADDPGAATIPLGVTETNLSNELGLALQAGVDIALGEGGFGLTLDAKRYFIGTTARWFAGDTLAIETEHNLDPWVLSAGVAYRF